MHYGIFTNIVRLSIHSKDQSRRDAQPRFARFLRRHIRVYRQIIQFWLFKGSGNTERKSFRFFQRSLTGSWTILQCDALASRSYGGCGTQMAFGRIAMGLSKL
jgi:hypothetical protein